MGLISRSMLESMVKDYTKGGSPSLQHAQKSGSNDVTIWLDTNDCVHTVVPGSSVRIEGRYSPCIAEAAEQEYLDRGIELRVSNTPIQNVGLLPNEYTRLAFSRDSIPCGHTGRAIVPGVFAAWVKILDENHHYATVRTSLDDDRRSNLESAISAESPYTIIGMSETPRMSDPQYPREEFCFLVMNGGGGSALTMARVLSQADNATLTETAITWPQIDSGEVDQNGNPILVNDTNYLVLAAGEVNVSGSLVPKEYIQTSLRWTQGSNTQRYYIPHAWVLYHRGTKQILFQKAAAFWGTTTTPIQSASTTVQVDIAYAAFGNFPAGTFNVTANIPIPIHSLGQYTIPVGTPVSLAPGDQPDDLYTLSVTTTYCPLVLTNIWGPPTYPQSEV